MIIPFLSNQQGAQDKSKRIDRDISKDQAAINKTIKLLMLGAGESGKSTIIKQMRYRFNSNTKTLLLFKKYFAIFDNLDS